MPLGKAYPLTADSMSAHWGPGPGSGSCWYHSLHGWRLAGPIGLDPLFSPLAIISRCPLVDSCSLPLERHTDYLLLGPPEPLSHWLQHSPPLSWSPSLSGNCRYVMQSKRRDDLSFSTACVSHLCCYVLALLAPRHRSSSDFLSPSETVQI